jgi:hypothetical protein
VHRGSSGILLPYIVSWSSSFGRRIAWPYRHAKLPFIVRRLSCHSGSAFRIARVCPRVLSTRYFSCPCLNTACASEPPCAGVSQKISPIAFPLAPASHEQVPCTSMRYHALGHLQSPQYSAGVECCGSAGRCRISSILRTCLRGLANGVQKKNMTAEHKEAHQMLTLRRGMSGIPHPHAVSWSSLMVRLPTRWPFNRTLHPHLSS